MTCIRTISKPTSKYNYWLALTTDPYFYVLVVIFLACTSVNITLASTQNATIVSHNPCLVRFESELVCSQKMPDSSKTYNENFIKTIL